MIRKRKIGIEEYGINPKICPFCEKELSYEQRRNKFCDHSCSAAFNNEGVRRHGIATTPCLNCGGKTSSHKNNYCGHSCCHDHQYKEYIEKWLSDESFGNKEKLPSKIRRWLKETRGNCCEECDWAEINPATGNVPVTVDHIDGNCCNNRPKNLKVLCPNCHSLTPTYGNLNKGNGRKSRREKRRLEEKIMRL